MIIGDHTTKVDPSTVVKQERNEMIDNIPPQKPHVCTFWIGFDRVNKCAVECLERFNTKDELLKHIREKHCGYVQSNEECDYVPEAE